MYKASTIQTGLTGRLGWRDATASGYPTMTGDNTTANSGLYFQDFHNLVTIPNIYNCQQDRDISDANFNTYLLNLQKAVINDVCNLVFNGKNDLVQNTLLYPYENSVNDTIENSGDFVGFEIFPEACKTQSLVINQILTQFDSVDSVTIYLFHSSQQAAVKSETITTQALSAKLTRVTDWFCDWTTYKGGKWYLGYLTNGLTAKALNRDYDLANVKREIYGNCIRPIKVPGHTATTLPDIELVDYESETWGLNLDVSVKRDFTDAILMNPQMFDNAIGLRMAYKVLELIATTTRSNNDERILTAALGELNATEQQFSGGGIKNRYEKEIEKLSKNFLPKTKIKTFTAR